MVTFVFKDHRNAIKLRVAMTVYARTVLPMAGVPGGGAKSTRDANHWHPGNFIVRNDSEYLQPSLFSEKYGTF